MIILINDIDVTDYITSISLNGDLKGISRTLNISYISNAKDKNIAELNSNLGNIVKLFHQNKNLFYGKIFERQKTTDSNSIDLVCFDGGIVLKKNKGIYKINGMNAEDIVIKICKDFNIHYNKIEKTNIKVTGNYINKSIYDIIMNCYTKAYKKTDKKYMVRFINDKLNIIEKGKKENAVFLTTGVNLITSAITESASDMINKILVIDDKNNIIKTIKNDTDIKLFHMFTEIVKANKDKSYTNNDLETIQSTITVTNFGDTRLITGEAVILKEPFTNLYGYFYIESDTHSFKNGIYTNKLTLNLKNIMDEKEVEDINKKQNANKNTNKNTNTKDNYNLTFTEESQRPLV